jgi:acetyl-CoA carboxylase carboxyl transferase subunit alpha
MRITSDWMLRLGVVDAVVSEPLGGAHRDPVTAIDALGEAFAAQLDLMAGMNGAALIADRNVKYMRIGDHGLD